jgi:hypothetical protein
MDIELEPMEPLLAGSPFADQADFICRVLRGQKIATVSALDNASRSVGPKIAGYSTGKLVAYLRDAAVQRLVEEAVNPIEQIEEEE